MGANTLSSISHDEILSLLRKQGTAEASKAAKILEDGLKNRKLSNSELQETSGGVGGNARIADYCNQYSDKAYSGQCLEGGPLLPGHCVVLSVEMPEFGYAKACNQGGTTS